MKKEWLLLILVLVGLTLASWVISDRLVDSSKKELDEKLEYMWQNVVTCDEVAKCMGASRGVLEVVPYTYTTHGGGLQAFGGGEYQCSIQRSTDKPYKYKTTFGNETSSVGHENIGLKDIRTILNGCKHRACGKSCGSGK